MRCTATPGTSTDSVHLTAMVGRAGYRVDGPHERPEMSAVEQEGQGGGPGGNPSPDPPVVLAPGHRCNSVRRRAPAHPATWAGTCSGRRSRITSGHAPSRLRLAPAHARLSIQSCRALRYFDFDSKQLGVHSGHLTS